MKTKNLSVYNDQDISRSSSTFGLQTHDQMEKEFNKFTLQYRKEVEAKRHQKQTHGDNAEQLFILRENVKQKFTNKNIPQLKRIQNSMSIQNADTLAKAINLCYRKPVQDLAHMTICKHLRSQFFGSFFQGLVLLTVKNLKASHNDWFKQYNSEVGEIQNFIQQQGILNQFNIIKLKVDNFKKPQDKIKYIQEQMSININQHLDQYEKLLLESQKQQNKFDEQRQKQKEDETRRIQKNLYQNQSSLIKSRFSAIKGILYQQIFSKLGEWENQILICEAIKQGKKLSQIQNFEGVYTEEVLRSENTYGNSLRGLHHSTLERYKKQKSKSVTTSIISWDEKKESHYQNKILKTGNFKPALLFSEMIHNDFHQQSQLRERLIKKYFDEGLDAKELKFLNDTCELINQNIDREFEKQKLKALDQELINQMELKVVEELLQQFNHLKVSYTQARQQYLKNRTSRVSKENIQREIGRRRIASARESSLELRKKTEFFRHRIKNMDQRLQHPNVMIYVRMFVEALKRSVRRTAEMKEQGELVRYLKESQTDTRKSLVFFLPTKLQTEETEKELPPPLLKSTEVLKNKRFTYHPPSKLMIQQKIKNGYYSKTYQGEKIDATLFFKRNYNDSMDLKSSRMYTKFYTGGPLAQKKLTFEQLNFYVTQIQRVYRGYKVRKNFKQFQERRYKQITRKVFKIYQNQNQSQIVKNSLVSSLINISRTKSTAVSNRSPTKASQQSMKNSILSTMRASSVIRQRTQSSIQRHVRTESSQLIDAFTKQQDTTKLRALFRMAEIHKTEEQFVKAEYELTPEQVNKLDPKGNSPLYYACKRGCLSICIYLMKLGGNINQVCSNGDTPLHMAIKSKKEEIILYLLQRTECDYNKLNNENQTPLSLCPQKLLNELGLSSKVVVTIGSRSSVKFDNNKVIFGFNDELNLSN